MKKTWKCPKCESTRIGYLETLPDGSHGHCSTERKIGEAPVGTFFGLTGYRATAPVEAFVCTACGYFEEYVSNPGAVPWDSLRGFRWCRR
jgi:hypothetical protein